MWQLTATRISKLDLCGESISALPLSLIPVQTIGRLIPLRAGHESHTFCAVGISEVFTRIVILSLETLSAENILCSILDVLIENQAQ